MMTRNDLLFIFVIPLMVGVMGAFLISSSRWCGSDDAIASEAWSAVHEGAIERLELTEDRTLLRFDDGRTFYIVGDVQVSDADISENGFVWWDQGQVCVLQGKEMRGRKYHRIVPKRPEAHRIVPKRPEANAEAGRVREI